MRDCSRAFGEESSHQILHQQRKDLLIGKLFVAEDELDDLATNSSLVAHRSRRGRVERIPPAKLSITRI